MTARQPPPRRIVVSRTDRIGDVVLSLPVAGALRRAYPGAELCFLGRRYVRDVIDACEHVDRFVAWPDEAPSRREAAAIVRAIGADAIVHVFPRERIAWGAWRAGVARRIGTSRRWYHWFACNERVRLSRKRSALHEAELNLRMAAPLLAGREWSIAESHGLYGLTRAAPLPARWSAVIDARRFNLVVSPLTGGTDPAWPLDQWRAFIDALDGERFRVFVAGSAAEGATLRPWLDALPRHATDITGQTLAELMAFIRASDGFVAASTGPLHIAAALGARALGLYPASSTGVPARWRPIGARAELLTAPEGEPAAGGVRHAVAGIAVRDVLRVVERWAASAAER